MSRRVQVVLLCEDVQHECFLRRFLRRRGFDARKMRVERAPGGGAADAWVLSRFRVELQAIRTEPVARALVVMIDGDRFGREERLRQLEAMSPGERVAIFVPTWNIETWLAYLDGQEVDESRKDYPRLERESDCQRHVDALAKMCDQAALREPAPPSLRAACEDYRRFQGGSG